MRNLNDQSAAMWLGIALVLGLIIFWAANVPSSV